jgi:putative acetyltransferase
MTVARVPAPGVHRVRRDEGPRLLEVWEASVRATHAFLTEADVQSLKPLVLDGVFALPDLWCARDSSGLLVAFLGVADGNMEALFVDPAWRGAGLGRRLAEYGMSALGVTRVDVNEQNPEARGFYERLGFEVYGRSPLDGGGRPFPLLHMRLRGGGSA